MTKLYTDMVIDWLREIAINNIDCNRQMTFLDAVEDIRNRASYGLRSFFEDKLYEIPTFRASINIRNYQDTVNPFHKCQGEHYTLIQNDEFSFCPYCGKHILWEGR